MEQETNNSKNDNENIYQSDGKNEIVQENIDVEVANEDSASAKPIKNSNEKEKTEDQNVDVNNEDSTAVENPSLNLKQLLGVGKPHKLTYSRSDLINISGNASSKSRPSFLLKEYDGLNGRWDPETWIKQTSASPSAGSSTENKSKLSNIGEDKYQYDNSASVVLRPQRSFREGCHVSSGGSSRDKAKSMSYQDSQLNNGRGARARVLRSRSEISESDMKSMDRERDDFEWERSRDSRRDRFRDSNYRSERGRGRDLRDLRDRRDLDKDYNSESSRDYKDRSYQSARGNYLTRRSESYTSYSNAPRSSNRARTFSEHEEEPEWFSEGPTSQFDTIELGGFDDDKADDFSWMGKEMPTDDLDLSSLQKNKKTSGENKHNEKDDQKNENEVQSEAKDEKDDKKDNQTTFNPKELDKIKESNEDREINPEKESANEDNNATTSRFSQWFNKQIVNDGVDSRESPSQDELEKLVEFTAESEMEENEHKNLKEQLGLSSMLINQHNQQASNLLREKLGLNKNPSPIQGNSTPPQYTENMSDVEALKKLFNSIREKDQIKRENELVEALANTQNLNGLTNVHQIDPILLQNILQAQSASEEGIYKGPTRNNIDATGQRIPSPEELVAHTQNIFQKALIKKQLEKQKDAYKEKIRMIEQQRREEQLREAIRSVNEKMYESKQYQKNLAFTPTSVIRKMHESRNEKVGDNNMYMQQQQDMMMNQSSNEALESATASLAAKLANLAKKPQQVDVPQHSTSNQNADSELLARIYQSAALPSQKQGITAQKTRMEHQGWNAADINNSEPNQRPTGFSQPLNSASKNYAGDSAMVYHNLGKDKRNNASMKHPVNYHQHMQAQLPQQQQMAADFYNNNLKHNAKDLNKEHVQPNPDAAELRHQEVAQLTANVLSEAGISEEKLSSLTVAQQQQVINIVQKRYHELQRQKQLFGKRIQQNVEPEGENRGDFISKQSNDDATKKMLGEAGIDSSNERKAVPESLQQLDSKQDGKNFIRNQSPNLPAGAGLLNNTPRMHQQIPHPMHTASLVPPPIGPMPNMFPHIPRAGAVVPTAFIPPPHHSLVHPPNTVSIAPPYPMLHIQQLYAHQHQQRLLAAAIQQQQQQQLQAQLQAQVLASSVRKQQYPRNKSGEEASNFSNPLERWFGPEVLTQSQLPPLQNHLTLSEVERMQTKQQSE